MRLFKKTQIDFMAKRKIAYFLSAGIILVGMASLVIKGFDYGIDFLGGTELVVSFTNEVRVGEVRAAMDKVGVEKAEIKTFGSDREILIRTPEQAEGASLAVKIREGLATAFPTNPFHVLKEDKIGPKVGAELRRDAFYAVIASLIAIGLYVAVRFKFVYGVGAVVSLFHDLIITLGVVSLCDGIFNLEINQNMIAAFLTLLGLSINDTVVIFDRMRENQKIFRGMSLVDVMNKSLNETLSRTVITSGMIFLVLIVMLIFGGEVNRGFAFTLAFGILTGTFSSIYIASAVVLEWANYTKKEAKLIN
jgi:preprotein translocase subunit SecF